MSFDLAGTLDLIESERTRSHQTPGARGAGGWGGWPPGAGGCRRAVQYRERPPADLVVLPEPKRPATIGTLIHEATLSRAAKLPGVVTSWRIPVPGLDRGGELDAWEPDIGEVTDLKTTGDYKWEQLRDHPDGFDADWKQAHIYGLALTRLGETVRTIRIVYIDRRTGGSLDVVHDYDPQLAADALDEVVALVEALDRGDDLPRDRRGPDLDRICERCPFRVTCYDLDEAAERGRTPYGWATVRDDEQIEQACADWLDDPSATTRAMIRDALVGVPNGRYGAYELRWTRPRRKPPVPDLERRTVQLAEEITSAAAEGRPPRSLAMLPTPTITPDPTPPRLNITRAHPAELQETP